MRPFLTSDDVMAITGYSRSQAYLIISELNRELGAYAAPRCDYVVLVGEKQAPPLLEGLTAAGFAAQRIFVAKTLQEGLNWVNGLPFDRLRTVLLENDLPDNF